MEKVLDFAAVDDPTLPTNPARSAVIALKLGTQNATVRHHPAVPCRRLPEFVQSLRERDASATAQALEFVILTAGRLSEVRKVTWHEIDMDTATWTVPASRMKMKREHRVPLSERRWRYYRAAPRPL
ncbi:tyrosine-type recombinase/integrase [Lichenicola cladoniae]|uniref:Tyrosine-type recombinase/integrase n=1 Tax=Lichenicola cladoniae TaxID=1484109 RepID=A0A6M8HU26_9PROT|nr:tyrosine-type recombinase/integrase [Lichenicola cladoniae]NPD67526.1 tyrosine-type recombinase/integrase [Acetobacteraceae bacterium]QKE91820.1 tyrosine-type recombinase/integrase [Lichenicola cladoniae]